MPPIYADGDISATGDPIHFMFGSRVGFSGSADPIALLPAPTHGHPGVLILDPLYTSLVGVRDQ